MSIITDIIAIHLKIFVFVIKYLDNYFNVNKIFDDIERTKIFKHIPSIDRRFKFLNMSNKFAKKMLNVKMNFPRK